MQALAREAPPGIRFAPLHYLKEGLAIARLDEGAIQRASVDDNALIYGLLFSMTGSAFSGIAQAWAGRVLGRSVPLGTLAVEVFLTVGCTPFLAAAYYGVCHGLARFLFGARGRYLGILRAMMLGSIVSFLGVLPLIGGLVAGLWSLVIFMWVFQEVDRIERLQAAGIAIGLAVLFVIAVGAAGSLVPD